MQAGVSERIELVTRFELVSECFVMAVWGYYKSTESSCQRCSIAKTLLDFFLEVTGKALGSNEGLKMRLDCLGLHWDSLTRSFGPQNLFCPASLTLSRELVNFVCNHLMPRAISSTKLLRFRCCVSIFGCVLGLWRNCVFVF